MIKMDFYDSTKTVLSIETPQVLFHVDIIDNKLIKGGTQLVMGAQLVIEGHDQRGPP